MGLIQEVKFFEDGVIRLEAANGRAYCSRVSPSTRAEIVKMLESAELAAGLDEFGDELRYPDCFLQEELTIVIAGQGATARIDALEGDLLSLIEELEEASREQFGPKYMISLVERATDQQCKGAGALEGGGDA